MNATTVAQTIQVVLTPVVMITACAVLLGGLLAHYAAVNDRLRAMGRERLDLLRTLRPADSEDGATGEKFSLERLDEIDTQAPELLHRHRLLRDAVLAVYCAILTFVASMFLIAAAALSGQTWIAGAALVVFLGGTAVLMLAIAQTAAEVRNSHHALHFEIQRVLALPK